MSSAGQNGADGFIRSIRHPAGAEKKLQKLGTMTRSAQVSTQRLIYAASPAYGEHGTVMAGSSRDSTLTGLLGVRGPPGLLFSLARMRGRTADLAIRHGPGGMLRSGGGIVCRDCDRRFYRRRNGLATKVLPFPHRFWARGRPCLCPPVLSRFSRGRRLAGGATKLPPATRPKKFRQKTRR